VSDSRDVRREATTTKAGRSSRCVMRNIRRRVIAREHNVLRVDFQKDPDPPAPRFPGAAAMRDVALHETNVIHSTSTLRVA
jgi:hypothetical protein